ncbi:MAG: ABC transporter substrate-binding protein [Phaeodactylibacter sp.]|nr:ABC transporter substrate-binding protein [Phaeodactylibacter sp.]MCB9048679.1 ABC transporter substrate-binding protein [Lewinellaceae bacterium]
MKKSFTDQLGRTILIDFPPRRIISLVPSQTELLAHLGLEEETIGITKFCVHPEQWFRSKARVGGTKQLDPDKIDALQPGLIIGNKEENDKEQIEALAAKYPVWLSDVKTLEDALEMIVQVGALANRTPEANRLAGQIRNRFEALQESLVGKRRRRVAYLIWRKPYYVVGSDTFIHDMLERAGLDNVFGQMNRYPEASLEQLAEARPEAILLSSEPYPFKEKHLEELRKACPITTLKFVDGQLFSWYGSRLLLSPDYFMKVRHGLAEAYNTL